MANPVNCTSCGTQLEQHCEGRDCRWLKCPNLLNCEWRIYDLDHNRRLDKSNVLGRIAG